jgi:hypothetical protein
MKLVSSVIPVLAALVLLASGAQAETVTHQFTGHLTTITDGSGGTTADLTGLFTMGEAVTLEYTIERSTTAEPQDPHTSGYTGAITTLSFSIGSWSGSGTPGYSFTTVVDNEPSPVSGVYDEYSAQVQGGITAPPIGNAQLTSLTYTFDDVQGTVFNSTAIPAVFPDLGSFEGKTLTVLLFDMGTFKSGYVMATFDGGSTPAQASTWGQLKGLYR